MSEVFSHPNVTPIFVSEFMREVAETFAQRESDRGLVIHNVINSDDFPFTVKNADLRKSILWIRSFSTHNYANDLSRDFILSLSEHEEFKDINISIFGDGVLFEDIVAPLRNFDNIKIQRGFLSKSEIKEQHASHGVKLVPSRWDSQGLTCGEAMSSGLVPLTSAVAALPEFLDEDVAILAPFDDHQELVSGYLDLLNDPERFLEMSRTASERSQSQCNPNVTTDHELKLFKAALND